MLSSDEGNKHQSIMTVHALLYFLHDIIDLLLIIDDKKMIDVKKMIDDK